MLFHVEEGGCIFPEIFPCTKDGSTQVFEEVLFILCP